MLVLSTNEAEKIIKKYGYAMDVFTIIDRDNISVITAFKENICSMMKEIANGFGLAWSSDDTMEYISKTTGKTLTDLCVDIKNNGADLDHIDKFLAMLHRNGVTICNIKKCKILLVKSGWRLYMDLSNGTYKRMVSASKEDLGDFKSAITQHLMERVQALDDFLLP